MYFTLSVSRLGLLRQTCVPCVARTKVPTLSFNLKIKSKRMFGPYTKTRFIPSKTMFSVFRHHRADRERFFLVAYHMPEQCVATTRQGTQCKRRALLGNTVCSLHTSPTASCPVCLDGMSPNRQTRTLTCGHTFHLRCLERWKRMSRTCPMCREPFDQPQYKVRVSVQRLPEGGRTASHTYMTTNVSALVTSFGIDPFVDSRFVTDILFDVNNDETLTDVFNELGLRIPPGLSGADAPTTSDQPDT